MLLGALVVAGCATGAPREQLTPPQPAALPSKAEINQFLSVQTQNTASFADYRIGPQDLLQITLFNVPQTEVGVTPRMTELMVSQQGFIVLPLLGQIAVMGLSTTELEEKLRVQYKHYLHDPQVGVLVKEYHSRKVSVIGAVQQPGVFELSGPKTLIDLLAMAGGVSEKAGTQVHLYRQGSEGRQNYVVDLYALTSNIQEINLPVQAEDVINVPRAGSFFVDGAVLKPGSYPLDRPYSVSQALAAAGGIDDALADASKVTIFRHRSPTDIEAISIDINAIRSQSASDPQLSSDDVVFVPTSTAKFIVKRFLGALGMGLSIPVL